MTSVIENKRVDIRGNSNLQGSIKSLLQAYGEQLEKVKSNPAEVQKIADELKSSDAVITDVVANTQQQRQSQQSQQVQQDNPGVRVLERDPSGFARVTEGIPGVNIFTGQPSPFAPQNQIQASQKLPDSLADQVPSGKVQANVAKQLEDQARSGEKLATSADDVQSSAQNSIQPSAQPRTQPNLSIPPSQAAIQPPVNPTAPHPHSSVGK